MLKGTLKIAFLVSAIATFVIQSQLLTVLGAASRQPLQWKFKEIGKPGKRFPEVGRVVSAPTRVAWIAFSSNGQTMVVAKDPPLPTPHSWQGPFEVWNVKSLRRRKTFGRINLATFENMVLQMAVSPSGRIVAVLHPSRLVCWDIDTGQKLREITLPAAVGHGPAALTFFSEESLLVSGVGSSRVDVYNWKQNAVRDTGIRRDDFSTVSFSNRGDKVCVANVEDAIIYSLSPQTVKRRFLCQLSLNYFSAPTFSPDGRKLVSRSDKSLLLWDAGTGKILRRFAYSGLGELFASSPNGDLLVNAGNGIRLWNLKSRRYLGSLEHGQEYVSSICFSKDGQLLASGSPNGTVRLWSVPTRY